MDSNNYSDQDSKLAIHKIFDSIDQNVSVEQKRPIWSAAITFALVALLGTVLWYSFPKEAEHQEISSVPIITADTSAYKVEPVDPGGMKIHHKDSTVYETLQASSKPINIERVMPQAEKPMDRMTVIENIEGDTDVPKEVVLAQLKAKQKLEEAKRKIMDTSLSDELSGETVVNESAPQKILVPIEKITEKIAVVDSVEIEENVQQVPEINVDPPEVAAILESEVDVQQVTVTADKLASTEPAAGPSLADVLNPGKKYFVQLASLGTESAAEIEWDRLAKKMSMELSGQSYRIKRADLGEKGVFYRIQVGPFGEGAANKLCAQIKMKRPGGCLVIRD
jgi:hypothetical protein